MLFNYLGEPVFQNGLGIYLRKHQYSNTIPDDLWQALSEASGSVSLRQRALLLPGYPNFADNGLSLGHNF
jgi:aminopeptidase N